MKDSPKDIWGKCLMFIKNNIGEQPYNTWFRHINFYSYESNVLRLSVPNRFLVEYIESHYLELMRITIRKFYGQVRLGYHIEVDQSHDIALDISATQSTHADIKNQQPSIADSVQEEPEPLDSNLNPENTFENFVVGESNKLPVTVAEAIANKYQNTFNPFYLFGASGVGKSHLINAIGIKIKELYPNKRVIYISAHLFQIQYVDAVRKNRFNDFMHFYQSIDVLIVDDIQEISGKEGTQEAFFNIFNHLRNNQKQIVLASDRPPVSLNGLQDRLLSRFKWGMIAELERPNYQLRRDILNYKIQNEGLSISEQIIDYIAEKVVGSVRDLEGIINSVMAYSIACNTEINLPLVEQVISQIIRTSKKNVTKEEVQSAVCKKYSVKPIEITSLSRKKNVVSARQIIVYLLQKYTDLSTTQIGTCIGRDHSTVIHSSAVVKKRMDDDNDFKLEVNSLEKELATEVN